MLMASFQKDVVVNRQVRISSQTLNLSSHRFQKITDGIYPTAVVV